MSFNTALQSTTKRPLDKKSIELIKIKHRTWKRYINTKDVKVYREYRKITNKVRKCTRDINRNEQCEVAKNVKDNPKTFWNYVNGKRKCKDVQSSHRA